MKSGLDAMPLFLLYDQLNSWENVGIVSLSRFPDYSLSFVFWEWGSRGKNGFSILFKVSLLEYMNFTWENIGIVSLSRFPDYSLSFVGNPEAKSAFP